MNEKNQLQIEKAQQYASSKGGFCLSTVDEYQTGASYLTWKCQNESHPSWRGVFRSVVHGKTWCPKCKYSIFKPDLLKEAQSFAKNKGGECLSTEYINNKTKMLWKCHISTHNIWSATFNAVKDQNMWCPECLKEKKALKINQAHEIAKKKNGQCLSKEYIHGDILLEWKCHVPEHNSWKARLRNILYQDQWCPECANVKNKTEHRVRMFLETYFGFKLPNTKPLWNVNPKTGRLLEFDGYNEEHKIAFEHDGEHHFEHTLYSNSIPEEIFQIQLERDKVKKENCLKQGVRLISIPILDYTYRYQFFPLLKHVIKHCKEQNLNLSYTLTQIKEMKKAFSIFAPSVKEPQVLIKIKNDNDFFTKINQFETLDEILIYYEYSLANSHKKNLRDYISNHVGEEIFKSKYKRFHKKGRTKKST